MVTSVTHSCNRNPFIKIVIAFLFRGYDNDSNCRKELLDTLYLFTTHNEDGLVNDFYTMYDWRCFSTKDMVNWTDHGSIFSLDDISWADDRAWAPQAIERDGKFFLYCPVHKKDGSIDTIAKCDGVSGV